MALILASNALAIDVTANPSVDVKSQNVVSCVISEQGYQICTADDANPSTIPFSGTLKISGTNSNTAIVIDGMPANAELFFQDLSIKKLTANCDATIKTRGDVTITAANDDSCIEQGGSSQMITISGLGNIRLNGSNCTNDTPIVDCEQGITFSNTGSVTIATEYAHSIPVQSSNAIFNGNSSVSILASTIIPPVFYSNSQGSVTTLRDIKGDIELHGGTSQLASIHSLNISGNGNLVLDITGSAPCLSVDDVTINIKGDITTTVKNLFSNTNSTNLTAKNINITKTSSDGAPLFTGELKIAATGNVVIDGGAGMIISGGPIDLAAKSMTIKSNSANSPMFCAHESTMKFVTTDALSFEAPYGALVFSGDNTTYNIECGNLNIIGNTKHPQSMISGSSLNIDATDVVMENKGTGVIVGIDKDIIIVADNLSAIGNGTVNPILNCNKTFSAEVSGDILIENKGVSQTLFGRNGIYLKGKNITINSKSNPVSNITAESGSINVDASGKLTINNSGSGWISGVFDAKCKDFEVVSHSSSPVFTHKASFTLDGGDFYLDQEGYMIAGNSFSVNGANNVSIATKSSSGAPVFGGPLTVNCSGEVELSDNGSTPTALLSSASTINAGKGITISTNGRLSYSNGHNITAADDVNITVGVSDSNPSGAYGLSNITSDNGTVTYMAGGANAGHTIFTQSPLSESTPLPNYHCYIVWPNGATTYFETRNEAMPVYNSSSTALLYIPLDSEKPENIYKYTDDNDKEITEILPNIVDITDPDNYVCLLFEIHSGEIPFIKEGFTAVDAVSVATKKDGSEWSSAYLPFLPDNIDENMTSYHIGSANETSNTVYIEVNDDISANSVVVLQPGSEDYTFNGKNVEIVPTNITSASVTGAKMILYGSNVVVGKDLTTAIETINADKAQKAIKTIENGRVVIIRGDKKYDLSGREL